MPDAPHRLMAPADVLIIDRARDAVYAMADAMAEDLAPRLTCTEAEAWADLLDACGIDPAPLRMFDAILPNLPPDTLISLYDLHI